MRGPTKALDTSIAIETPEHIVFQHRLAGPARRSLAYVVDLFVGYGALALVAVLVTVVFGGLGALSGSASAIGKSSTGVLLVGAFFVQWVYFALLEGLTGRTPGKRAAGLRVVTTTGQPIGMQAAILRNLLRAADAMPTFYLVGVFVMAANDRLQRLGDLAAGTMVIVEESATFGATVRIFPPPEPRELAILPDHVPLDHEERVAIELFLRRKQRLGLHRSHELATLIAVPLARRLGITFPDSARLLALLYDRAANAGRGELAQSSRIPGSDPLAESGGRARPWR
ncbi:MAG: RDD family protein [Polyangiaceae bacterium]